MRIVKLTLGVVLLKSKANGDLRGGSVWGGDPREGSVWGGDPRGGSEWTSFDARGVDMSKLKLIFGVTSAVT